MSSTSLGNSIEKRFTTIMVQGLGYLMAAKAIRTPVYINRPGINSKRFVVGGGATDLVGGTIDRIFVKKGAKIAFVQITTVNGLSERRAKLRDIMPKLPMEHIDLILVGWDASASEFRVFRPEANFLDEGFRMDAKSIFWPWNKPIEQTNQVTLK